MRATAGNKLMEDLTKDVVLPRMAEYEQCFDETHIRKEDIPGQVYRELSKSGLSDRIRPGMKIAVTGGSRGIDNIALILKSIVDFCLEKGAYPFVFPAMGSHGGATAEGQTEILKEYGITEEYLGCPIRATMETRYLGDTKTGMHVFCDRYACESDGIILCNRIKAHSAFRGSYESGLMKMAVIGMGKQHGAEQVHRDGFSKLGEMLPLIGQIVFDHAPVLGGVGIVENAFDQTCRIRALTKEEIWTEEPKLLEYSKRRLGKIYLNDIDVLVVDQIGKDCSGDGMDPNITGRFAVDYLKGDLRVQRIAVLDLTNETRGSCVGIGLADVTTKRLVDKIDPDQTYPNIITNTVVCTVKIPMYANSDKVCIQAALRTCNNINREAPRIVRIKNTRSLHKIWISEAMTGEADRHAYMKRLTEPADWDFNEFGNLW